MARPFILLGTVLAMIQILSTEAYAWDGKRKGFILGGALGLGIMPYTRKLDYNYGYGYSYNWSKSETPSAVMTDFKIGYAPTDLVQLYYMNKVSWFKAERSLTLSGLTGIGVTYSFDRRAPSWFVTGGVGLAFWQLLAGRGDPGSLSGFGLVVGGGYEFSRHWSIEGNLLWGEPTRRKIWAKERISMAAIRVTISGLQY